MNAEIISIGTELLLGHIVNTNTSFLSRGLAEIGIDVYHQSVVGDNPGRLADAIKRAVSRSDIIITTGGLGPTIDDVTIETIAGITGKRLILNKTILKDLTAHFRLRGIRTPPESVRQAYIPEGVKWIRNRVGTAPGLIVEYRDKIIICLPGPPRELNPMFGQNIAPYLKDISGRPWIIKSRTIKTTGLAESQVNGMVKDLLVLKPPTTLGIYARLGEVELKIMSKDRSEKAAAKNIAGVEKKIRSRLSRHIFGYDEDALEGAVAKVLTKRKLTIAVAESCTGGLVSNRLTNVAGSSKYFIMGLVAYSNRIKMNILGVRQELLKRHGAVSKEVALEMAKGIRFLACSDIGIGITGIAGPSTGSGPILSAAKDRPTGGTALKPVGLVYIAIVRGKKNIVRQCRFKGSREEIKFQASQAALDMLRFNLRG